MSFLQKYFNKDTFDTAKLVIPLTAGILSISYLLKDKFELSYLEVSIAMGIIILLIIPLIAYNNRKRIESKIPLAIVKNEIEKEASKIDALIAQLNNPSDLYKLRLIAYRLRIELAKYKFMSTGLYPQFCLDHRMYFMYIFRSVLDTLAKGDIYRAVTTIDIWQFDEDDRKLINGYEGLPGEFIKSFLKANVQAAKRYVDIERYFIVDSVGMKDIHSEYHSNMKDTVQRIANQLDYDSRECKIFFCPTENYIEETKDDIAFALIRNEDKSSFMYLYSNMSNPLPSIEMNFLDNNSEENYQRLYGKLEYYRNKPASQKLTLQQMAAKLGIKKNTTDNKA